MTDTTKIQLIHDSPFRRDWNELPKEAKRQVLDSMDEGDSRRWIESLIEEARELNQQV